MIVLASGCFDPFHYGHLLHLQKAKKFGELLYVAVTRDACVNKGQGRPVFPEAERLEVVRSLSIVHGCFLCKSSLEAIKDIDPDVFVKGIEYKGKIQPEEEAYCLAHDIKIVFTNTKKYSSTDLLHFYDRLQQGL